MGAYLYIARARPLRHHREVTSGGGSEWAGTMAAAMLGFKIFCNVGDDAKLPKAQASLDYS